MQVENAVLLENRLTPAINPLPTNDAPMRHDLSELSISLWELILYGGFNTRRYTSVHGFCLF